MIEENRQLVGKFFAALGKGELTDDLFTEDMAVWATSSGLSGKARYQQGVRLLQTLFPEGLAYTVDSTTAEDDRVVAEVRSSGILKNGVDYQNTYVFIFYIRDGRIARVNEHCNPIINAEKLLPLFQQQAASQQQQ